METMLLKYLRTKHRRRRGMVIAFMDDDECKIGWSQCMDVDKWNKEVGVAIATTRAIYADQWANYPDKANIPNHLHKDFSDMYYRASNYFKQATNFPRRDSQHREQSFVGRLFSWLLKSRETYLGV
jgi:hypothetical protein